MAGVSVEIGAFLRQTREAIGLSLDEVQEKTKIQKSFLVAIENGEFHKLPSPFYVRTYLRSYANCLKIEPQHILRQYRKQEQEERQNKGIHGSGRTSQMTGHIPNIMEPNVSETNTTQIRPPILSNSQKHRRVSRQTALTVVSTQNNNEAQSKRRNLFATQQMNLSSLHQSKQEMAVAAEELSAQQSRQQKEIGKSSTSPRKMSAFQQAESNRSKNQTEIFTTANLDKKQTTLKSPLPNKNTNTNPNISKPDPSSINGSDQGLAGKTVFLRSAKPMSKLPNQPTPAEAATKPDIPKGDESLFPTRGRGKTSKRKVAGKRSTKVFIASAVICIPLLFLGYYFLFADKDDPKDETKTSTHKVVQNNSSNKNQSQEKPTQPQSDAGPGEVKISDAANNSYLLQGGDQLQIKIEATAGESWVNIRNQPKYNKEVTVKDATVKPKQAPLEYSYTFKDQPLFIQLGQPQNVKVYLNGDPIQSGQLIEIKKK
ncbi:hypothetical protein DL897_05130 [Thermoflavimicrobium daqui]|uniref:Helix-turn-helix domain-containing protein n=1 Tax=Thermoflavimicrobium daqui TaxID=2137476 RepID=A0A364K7U7_9BACL|nr:hypothetical protein DL897_05130 [Thermoflavimicrobium daqui]